MNKALNNKYGPRGFAGGGVGGKCAPSSEDHKDFCKLLQRPVKENFQVFYVMQKCPGYSRE